MRRERPLPPGRAPSPISSSSASAQACSGAGAAEGDEREVVRVEPSLDRDDAQRREHLGVHDLDHVRRPARPARARARRRLGRARDRPRGGPAGGREGGSHRSPSAARRRGRSRPGPGSAPALSGPTRSAPPASRQTSEPPPAPTVCTSSVGRRTGRPPTSRSLERVASPPTIAQTSVEVPPMSKAIAFSISSEPRRRGAAPTTPAAGPERRHDAGMRRGLGDRGNTAGRAHHERLRQSRLLAARRRARAGSCRAAARDRRPRRSWRRARTRGTRAPTRARRRRAHPGWRRRSSSATARSWLESRNENSRQTAIASASTESGSEASSSGASSPPGPIRPRTPNEALERHERLRMLGTESVEVGSVLPPEVQNMLEAVGRDEGGPSASPLEQGVRGDRRPVREALDARRARPPRPRRAPTPPGGARSAPSPSRTRPVREQDGVGEGAAHVDAEDRHGVGVRSPRASRARTRPPAGARAGATSRADRAATSAERADEESERARGRTTRATTTSGRGTRGARRRRAPPTPRRGGGATGWTSSPARGPILKLERPDEDVAYGMRLLADIAERSLADSPFQDRTSAVQAMDVCTTSSGSCAQTLPGTAAAGRRAARQAHGADDDLGGVRRARVHGDSHRARRLPQLSRRLKAALVDLKTIAPPDRVEILSIT